MNCLVILSLVLVLVCLAQSAPAQHRTKRRAPASNIKLSVVLNNDAMHEEAALVPRSKRASPLAKLFALPEHSPLSQQQPLSRSKRHVGQADLDFLSEAAAGAVRHGGRGKRSAAWWLHATIQMCDKYQHLCKSIEVKENDMVVEIRIEDE